MREKIKKINHFFKKNRNTKIFMYSITITAMYMFFFMSRTIFNVQPEKKSTDINTMIEIDQHQVTLAKWVYCKDTNTMEVEFNMVNTLYDGTDNYELDVIDRNLNRYETDVLFSKPTMTVIQIHNVPESFSEMRIDIKVDYGEKKSEESGKFYVNVETVEYVDSIVTYHTMEDYYVAKLSRYIENYNKQIEEIQAKMEVEIENEDNCYKQINDLNLQKKYTAGDELKQIENQINDINKKAIEYGKIVYEYNTQVMEIKQKIQDYENIMKIYQTEGNSK